MPAIAIEDLTVLPRISSPGLGDIVRPVAVVNDAPRGFEGEGFPVRRAFAGIDPSLLDPFIHMDQMGEVEYAPGEPKGTPWHPHRGFETVTYMIDGRLDHQDSTGGGGMITNGDTQWMTAGSGLLHIEAPPEWLVQKGGLFHGVQLWGNLPRAQKWAEPRYQDLRAGQVGLATTPDAGALVRVIAGDVAGQVGPGSTHTPMTMVHATLTPTAKLELPWDPSFNAVVYVLSGEGTVGVETRPVRPGNMAVLGRGDLVSLAANRSQDSRTPALDVLIIGGRPIREPLAWAGPFVMNTKAEVMQAFDDFQKGRMGQIPVVHGAPTEIVSH
ncbi:MAG: pirin family protein [Actinomycetota bacterium]|nr:pirin family protein [Actinomycetota bacterium]